MPTVAEAEREAICRLERNDPGLTDLWIGGGYVPGLNARHVGRCVPGNSTNFASLGQCIGRSTYLQVVHLVGNHDLGGAAGAFCEGVGRNESISELHLERCHLSEGAAHELLKALAQNGRNLKKLTLARCALGRNGARYLANVMDRCSCVGLLSSNIDDQNLRDIVASGAYGQLEMLDLSSNNIGRGGCDALAALLRQPDSSIRLLALDRNRIDDECAEILANALRNNTKLEELHLDGNPDISACGWDAFTRVLCSRASVNDTYGSNHVLEALEEFESEVTADSELFSLLEMNCSSTNKTEVAAKKVLRFHRHLDMSPFFRHELQMLPLAMSWLDRAGAFVKNADDDIDARALSTIYQFAQAMPMHLTEEEAQSK